MSQLEESENLTPIAYDIDHSIGFLRFNNPRKFNALPQAGWLAIAPAISAMVDAKVRVIVITGENQNFCAGADISEFDTVRKNAETAHIYEQSNIEAFAAIRNAPVPTIASIDGHCLGGGFGLAAACDLRFATPEAKFAVPAARLGLGYPVDAMGDIVGAIGQQNTKRLLFTAETFTASQMLDFGFLAQIVPQTEIKDVVMECATKISKLAPLTHHATKAAIDASSGGDRNRAVQLSDATFTSDDYAEGRRAFKERRKPDFSGD